MAQTYSSKESIIAQAKEEKVEGINITDYSVFNDISGRNVAIVVRFAKSGYGLLWFQTLASAEEFESLIISINEEV